ncbi:MAG TPA: hypothetical protein VGL63_03985 [Streptosporangiaceae bacterium]
MTDDRSLRTLTAKEFHGTKGARFRVSGGPQESGLPDSFEMELVDVAEYPERAEGTFRTPFSVVFHGPLNPVLPQGIYRLEQERLGALDLFIVPIGPDEPKTPGSAAKAMRYEAAFG